MGCFLSCFLSGRDRPGGDLLDPLAVESRLGDAFLDDGKKGDANGRLQEEGAGDEGGLDDELLLEEANFLKLCGTISTTPPEILKISSPVRFDDTNENDTSSNTQIMSEAMASKGNSSGPFNSEEQYILRLEEEGIVESTEHLFDAESKPLSSLQDKPSSQKTTYQMTDSNYSPFPTPLVLRGDIHTPGTVYTALTSKAGKLARADRQFIYPVLKPIENKMQWMELKVDSPLLSANPPKRRLLSPESTENPQEICSVATATENGKNGVSSLSYWLKLSSETEGDIGKESFYEKNIFDVPIFATSGLNWDENPTPVLPKAWDMNGIPNTTTKYQEDKVVSWHATPFEERLLKVLSSEKASPERKISGKLIQLEENSE